MPVAVEDFTDSSNEKFNRHAREIHGDALPKGVTAPHDSDLDRSTASRVRHADMGSAKLGGSFALPLIGALCPSLVASVPRSERPGSRIRHFVHVYEYFQLAYSAAPCIGTDSAARYFGVARKVARTSSRTLGKSSGVSAILSRTTCPKGSSSRRRAVTIQRWSCCRHLRM